METNVSAILFYTRMVSETNNANERSCETPAKLEPTGRIISDHILEAVIEAIHSETP